MDDSSTPKLLRSIIRLLPLNEDTNVAFGLLQNQQYSISEDDSRSVNNQTPHSASDYADTQKTKAHYIGIPLHHYENMFSGFDIGEGNS